MSLVERNNGNNITLLHKHIPPKLITYIKEHYNDGVIHLYYGRKMMSRRSWVVIPYEISIYDSVINNLHYLVLFTFLKDITFVLYNGTNKFIEFNDTNIVVISV